MYVPFLVRVVELGLLIRISRKGDYYRYLAEFGPVRDRGRFGEVSLQAYKAAYKRALATLHPLDPTRLGLALNFSVFYHGKFPPV